MVGFKSVTTGDVYAQKTDYYSAKGRRQQAPGATKTRDTMIKRLPVRDYWYGTPYLSNEVEIVVIDYDKELQENQIHQDGLFSDYEQHHGAIKA